MTTPEHPDSLNLLDESPHVRRCVLVLLGSPPWTPPGIDTAAWQAALAEDMIDLMATLADSQADTAIAAPADARGLAESIRWPGMTIYEAHSPHAALTAAATAGYQQAAVLAPDAPDLPAMLIGKLLRPLGSRELAVIPAVTGGVAGVAARLPAGLGMLSPDGGWNPDVPPAAAQTPAWHRLTSPAGLAYLDLALEGWEVTRALLTGQGHLGR